MRARGRPLLVVRDRRRDNHAIGENVSIEIEMNWEDGEYRINLNGVLHWCRVAGSIHQTIPLLILHGGPGGNVYNFERTIGPLLEAFSTVLYFEQRGCGRSELPATADAYSWPLLISDLEQLLQAFRLSQVIPLGFSFGGELALEFALSHPGRVAKLVLQAPGVALPGRTTATQLHGFEQVTFGRIWSRIHEILAGPELAEHKLAQIWDAVEPADVDRFLFHQPAIAKLNRQMWQASGLVNTGLMAKALRAADDREPLLFRVKELDIPTLVMVGLYDRNSGVDVNRDLALRMPNARLVVFGESAHFPDMEEPARYAREVQAFVQTAQ